MPNSKTLNAILLAIGTFLAATSGAADETGTIRINIEGARNNKGAIGCAIYSLKKKKHFPSESENATQQRTVPVKSNGGICVFSGIPAGTYAIGVMHDEDRDGKLDTKIFGIPTEGWAVSNNHKGKRMRGPKFEEAQFVFDGTAMTHKLQLNYR